MKKAWGKLNKKGLEKVVAIGKIAAELFNDKGYLQTSMDDIANGAEMSKGGVYHYFSNKDEILYFILNNYMDLLLENLEKDLKKIDGNYSKIQFITSRHIALYTRYLNEGKTLLHETPLLPKKYYKIIAEKEKKYYRIIANILSDFFDGHIEKGKLTVLTFTLLGMCNWIHSWYNPKGSVTPQELSEIIYDIFSSGMDKVKQSISQSRRDRR
jgi:AcrR family transcriptional regulator